MAAEIYRGEKVAALEPLRLRAHNLIGPLHSLVARLDAITATLENRPREVTGRTSETPDHPPMAIADSIDKAGAVIRDLRDRLDEIERIIG